MLLSLLFLISSAALIGLLIFYNCYYKRRKLPPGPLPLPLLGNLLSLKRYGPEECFRRWARQYGQMFTLWISEIPLVCLTNYAKIVETFQKDGESYAGRFSLEEWDNIIKGGNLGILSTEGEHWREQRRFALHVLRDFGLGRNLMQEKILSEVDLMFTRVDRELAAEDGREVNISEILDINVGSIINNLLFGYRFDDERLDEFWEVKNGLQEMIKRSFDLLHMLFQGFPRLFRRLPYFGGKMEITIEKERNFLNFFARQIRTLQERMHIEGHLEGPPSNFVEAFLKEKARRDANGEKHGFSIDQLKGVCADLWIAGQETTSTTLTWGINHLINLPVIQLKVQEELDNVIGGTDIVVTTASRPELPYTNAVINEIQRMANLLPLNVVHKLTRDVVIDGHFLPKGTAIVPQVSAVLADGENFDNPGQFRPQRFLDENGRLKRVDELIPFSVGKRQCLGESLARMELFLFLANLLNKYQFLPGKAGAPSQERELAGMVHSPAFTCRVLKRKQQLVE